MKPITAKLSVVCISLIVIGLLFTGVSNANIDPSKCVGVWLFDEGKGEIAKDISGNGKDGKLNGKTKWVNGKFGSALEFGTMGDHVFIEDILLTPTGWSISAWLNRAAGVDAIWLNHNNKRVSKSSLHLFFPGSSDKLTLYYYDDAPGLPVANTPFKEGVWTHIVFVVNPNGNREAYVNGNLDSSDKNTMEYGGGAAPLLIGKYFDCCQYMGLIDDVGVFNVALTKDDVVNIMTNGLGKATGLTPVSPNGLLTAAWGEIRKDLGQK
jgi:hypothetical protein